MEPSASDRLRGYDLWSVGGKYQYDLGGHLLLNFQYQHVEAKLDNLSATRTRESRNDRNEEIASVRLDYVGSDAVQLFLKGYYHDWNTAYVQIRNDLATGAPVVVYPAGTYWGYRDLGASALARLNLHRGIEYLVGYDYQNFRGRDDVLLIGDTRETVHAGTFQIRTTSELSHHARFAAGVRYNDGSDTNATVWNVSGRYDVSANLYFEANGGTSFLLPSASELYQIDPCCERGNPALDPERSLNLNIGAGGRFGGDRVTWKLSVFARRIDDLIDIDYDDPAYPDGIYVNSDGRVNVHGAKPSLRYGWPAAGRPRAASPIAGHATRDRTASATARPKPSRTARSPISPTTVRSAPAPRSTGWANAWSSPSGFARRNYGNYAVVDLGAHFYPDGAARRHRFGINVENVFDQDYATRSYASAARDDGSGRFLYFIRGVPRTLRVSYGIGF
jgi:vitamin B12 transporter